MKFARVTALLIQRLALFTAVTLLVSCGQKRPENVKAPPAPARAVASPKALDSVTDDYHGTKVTDPYRWLENAADSRVTDWSADQTKRTRELLNRVQSRGPIEARLTQLAAAPATNYFNLSYRPGQFFALEQPARDQPAALALLASPTNLASRRIVLDPNGLNRAGTMAIPWHVPSADGRLTAVCLWDKGIGNLHIYDVVTGQRREDVLLSVHTRNGPGSAAWVANDSGLLYTGYGGQSAQGDDKTPHIYLHKLGTSRSSDAYELGTNFPRGASVQLAASPDGQRVLATVANEPGNEWTHYLRDSSGKWHTIATAEDKITRVAFGRDPLYIEAGRDHALYCLSLDGAPRGKILRLPLPEATLARAQLIIPERTNVIHDFHPAASGLHLILMNGGPREVVFYDYADKSISRPRGEDRVASSIDEALVTRGDELLYRTVSYTHPFVWKRFNPAQNRENAFDTALEGESAVPFHDIELVREEATSRDGTRIPLKILRRKGTRLTGDVPTLLTAESNLGPSLSPDFDVTRHLWLEQGGVMAIAIVRGGPEFGEAWRAAGTLTNKQNAIDDFIACAERLMALKYTNPAKLGVVGLRPGGVLAAAALTQRPDLMQAAVLQDGIYDMLRAELDPAAARRGTEYGTIKDLNQFKALYAYSPYHRVLAKTNYPAMLMFDSDRPDTLTSAHSRKMTARLQAASGGTRPIMLRQVAAGPGIRAAFQEYIHRLSDLYSFLCEQLGLEYSLIDRGPWSGAVTPTTAIVKAKLVRPGLTARLAVSTAPLMSNPIYFGPVASQPDRHAIVEFQAAQLLPDTQYYYALEINQRLDQKNRGQFRTFPAPGPASFTMAFASCARTASTLDTFDRIREHHPLFYLHMGDFHYLDIRTNNRALFRAAYDTVLASPQQSDLYRQIPFVYIWDDHDFGGNNSRGLAVAHEAAWQTFDEYVPHYPLRFPGTNGAVAQSFSVGRVKFILTDLRSQRDDPAKRDGPDKSMMGARQKAWFKQELLSANGRFPLICWVSSDPWIGRPRTNYYHWIGTNAYGYFHHTNYLGRPPPRRPVAPADDHWSVFATERAEIANFIKANRIRGVCILHGDSHMLAADDGSHSDFATGGGAPIPVMCGAPLDQSASIKGGYYSQGVYRMRSGEGGFGLLTVSDQNDHLDVVYSGRNNRDEEKISLKFRVPAVASSTNP